MKFKIPFFIEKKLVKKYSQVYAELETTIFDINGKKIKSRKQIAKSLTGNFLQGMYCQISAANTVDFLPSTFNGVSGTNNNCKDTTGTLNGLMTNFRGNGVVNSPFGIVVGTGNTLPTPQDYIMKTLINPGDVTNDLHYYAQGSSQPVIAVGANTSFVLQRLFQNNSLGTITVNEIGLYAFNGSLLYLYFRDVVLGGDTLLPGQSYTVQITFNITT